MNWFDAVWNRSTDTVIFFTRSLSLSLSDATGKNFLSSVCVFQRVFEYIQWKYRERERNIAVDVVRSSKLWEYKVPITESTVEKKHTNTE